MKTLLLCCLSIFSLTLYSSAQTPLKNMKNPFSDVRSFCREKEAFLKVISNPAGEGLNRMFKEQSDIQVSKKRNVHEAGSNTFKHTKALVDTNLRYTYSYDNNGNLLSELLEKQEKGIWMSNSRSTFTYDVNNNLLTELYEEGSSGTLVNYFRSTCTYDNNGNLLSKLFEKLVNGSWVNYTKFICSYDANGNIQTELSEEWSNGSWVNESRNTYTYDANGHKLTALNERWSNGNWVKFTSETYTYDDNGHMTTGLFERWLNDSWKNSCRITYNYNNNGDKLSEQSEIWENGAWVNNSRYTCTYISSGKKLEETAEIWANGAWSNRDKYTYNYDNNGNMFLELDEIWSNGSWVNSIKKAYTYNNNNAVKGEAFQWSEGAWVPFQDFLFLEYNGGADKVIFFASKAEMEYTIVTAVENQNITAGRYSLSQNYPNPFNPVTSIKYSIQNPEVVTLKVFDVLGNEVATLVNEVKTPGSYEANFNAANLASGVYIYKLKAGKFVSNKKMLLIK